MENKYLKYNIKNECTGCGACVSICPVNAIRMESDEEGFLYPKIDEKICIKCNKCKKYCTNFNDNKEKSKTYRGINKNKEDLLKSSSGGMFLVLAKYIIKQNGVVFGVKYDKNLNVIHDYAENEGELIEFCGSKYVRSDLRNSYEQAKKFLDDGRMVLFTGTSCQIQGLNTYLTKEYENLITLDIICHANPSPKVFKMYIEEIEKTRNKKIKSIQFRSKEKGWRNTTTLFEFADGSKEEEKTFLTAFARELINRECCYNCKFASQYRISDITIGDFWGVEKIEPELDSKNGVSIFLVNTKKAEHYIEKIQENIDIKEVEFENIKRYNHFSNVIPHEKKNKFYKELNKGNKAIIELLKKYNKVTLTMKVTRKLRKILKK